MSDPLKKGKYSLTMYIQIKLMKNLLFFALKNNNNNNLQATLHVVVNFLN